MFTVEEGTMEKVRERKEAGAKSGKCRLAVEALEWNSDPFNRVNLAFAFTSRTLLSQQACVAHIILLASFSRDSHRSILRRVGDPRRRVSYFLGMPQLR
jgi:hypothetical protein